MSNPDVEEEIVEISDGDFLLIDYIAAVRENGEEKVFDTTVEEEAKKAGLEIERAEPELVIVGEGVLLKSVEEELKKAKIGEWKEIILSPEKAFGKRDPNKIIIVPARELVAQRITPRAGEEVAFRYRGRSLRGKIVTVGGGRVIIDTNHPLAGKTIVYRVKVLKKLETVEEKIKALLKRWIHEHAEKAEIKISDKTLTITLPPELLMASNIGIIINAFARDVEKKIKEVETLNIMFSYSFKKPKEAKEEEPEQEKANVQEDSEETSQPQSP